VPERAHDARHLDRARRAVRASSAPRTPACPATRVSSVPSSQAASSARLPPPSPRREAAGRARRGPDRTPALGGASEAQAGVTGMAGGVGADLTGEPAPELPARLEALDDGAHEVVERVEPCSARDTVAVANPRRCALAVSAPTRRRSRSGAAQRTSTTSEPSQIFRSHRAWSSRASSFSRVDGATAGRSSGGRVAPTPALREEHGASPSAARPEREGPTLSTSARGPNRL
jgi:hypothetical protein